MASELGEDSNHIKEVLEDLDKSDYDTIFVETHEDESETIKLERELALKLKEFEEAQKEREDIRKREEEERKKVAEQELKESELKWQLIQEKLRAEKDLIEQKKRQIEEQHNKMMEKEQKLINRNLEILKVNLQVFTQNFEDEMKNLEKLEHEKKNNLEKRHTKAATKIQKFYRGYRVRKLYGVELKMRFEDAKNRLIQQRIYEAELEEKLLEEKRRKEEEDRKRKHEQEIKRLKEQKELEEQMELMKLKQIEEENAKIEIEKKLLEEQENKYRLFASQNFELHDLQIVGKAESPHQSVKIDDFKSNPNESLNKSMNEDLVNNNTAKEEILNDDINIQENTLIEKESDSLNLQGIQETLLHKSIEDVSQISLSANEQSTGKSLNLDIEATVNILIKDKNKLIESKNDELEKNISVIVDEKFVIKNEKISEFNQESLPNSDKIEDKFYLDEVRLKIFNQWRKHNTNYFYCNLKNTYKNAKDTSKQLKSRPKSSRSKNQLSIPHDLVLKQGNKDKLEDISSLIFNAIPSYSFQTMEFCLNLSTLIINNCEFSTFDSLQNCVNLKYLDLNSNKIEWLELRNLPSLIFLNLSNNSLSSVQNLSDCINIRYLDLSNNKLTRLGFLNQNFSTVQYLNVSQNHLISTIGLSNCIQLQHIDLSSNNLTYIQDLESLALLLNLNASKNNLSEFPELSNQILMLKINFNENILSSINDISNIWMPFLRELHIDFNRINELNNLNGFLTMEELYLESNSLNDYESIKALEKIKSLKNIYLNKNPLVNEDIVKINGYNLNSEKFSFSKIDEVLAEDLLIQNFYLISNYLNQKLSEIYAGLSKKTNFNELEMILDNLLETSIKLRSIFEANDIQFFTTACIIEKINDYKSSLISFPIRPQSSRLHKKISSIADPNSTIEKSTNTKESNIKKIYDLTLDYQQYSKEELNRHATIIQSRWKGYKTRRDMDMEARNMAACIIQAYWKGYRVRKRIKNTKDTFQMDESQFEEIDLKEFDFDESRFDVKIASEGLSLRSLVAPLPQIQTKRAWGGSGEDILRDTSVQSFNMQKNPVHTNRSIFTPLSNPDSEASFLSNKQNAIIQDWGFKDQRSAALMLQRAERLKYKVERKNKIKSLDPKQRLMLLRKMDKYTPRMKENQVINTKQSIKVQQNVGSPQLRTYEWVHSQVRDLPPAPPPVPTSKNGQLSTIYEARIPKLPKISTSQRGSPLDGTSIKAKDLYQSKLFRKYLPPLNIHQDQQPDGDQDSIASSRSSFTQMYLNTSQNQKKNDYKNRRIFK